MRKKRIRYAVAITQILVILAFAYAISLSFAHLLTRP